MAQPPPKPLPPTSGRVEKHVHLESIVPEPTGEPLPESLLTSGFVYTATLKPERPEPEPTIEFHVHEQPETAPEHIERIETLQWYVKEGKPPSEIPDDESITTIGELRAATPPYHGELVATAQITPPTRVEVSVDITPPPKKPKAQEPPRLTAEAQIVTLPKPRPDPYRPVVEPFIPAPVKQFHFGDDEEDRLSVHSGHSWEEVTPATPRVVPRVLEPPKVTKPAPESQRNQFSRTPGAQGKFLGCFYQGWCHFRSLLPEFRATATTA